MLPSGKDSLSTTNSLAIKLRKWGFKLDGFWIGLIVALIAIFSFFKRNTKTGSENNQILFVIIGIIAAITSFIGYAFLGWRF